MKISKVASDDAQGTMRLAIESTSEAFVNALRRSIIEEVPTLAVEDVEMIENSSALYDEMLALRLGLTPIKTDLSSYSLPTNQAEIDERSAKCTLQLTLKANKKGIVYAEQAQSADPKCTFVHPKMPFVKLLARQKLDIQMTAVMGQGKTHTKWSPGHAWFRCQADLTINQDAALVEQFKAKYPAAIFDKSGKIDAKVIQSQDLVDAVDGVCDELITVEYKNDAFDLFVESWGQLSCKEMVTTAAQILDQKAEELKSLI